MEPSELLRYVVGVLESLNLPYLITGSTATIAYGEPRLTNDIDIVVRHSPQEVTDFCRAFPSPEYYLSPDAAKEAVAQGGQFNIIHPTSGLRIDVMIARDTPFDRSRFSRSKRIKPTPEFEAAFASVEDVILKKIEYYREGGSEKHLRDITGVLRVSGQQIDHAYISDWASRLGLEAVWRAILGE
ncbi:MAG: hypothetical protein ACE5GE_15760 [Phycisphaerae bacterium]